MTVDTAAELLLFPSERENPEKSIEGPCPEALAPLSTSSLPRGLWVMLP